MNDIIIALISLFQLPSSPLLFFIRPDFFAPELPSGAIKHPGVGNVHCVVIRNVCGRMLARRVYGRTIVVPIILSHTHTHRHTAHTGTQHHIILHTVGSLLSRAYEVKVNDDYYYYYCREMCNYQHPEMASANAGWLTECATFGLYHLLGTWHTHRRCHRFVVTICTKAHSH